jgi:hypothetical protein
VRTDGPCRRTRSPVGRRADGAGGLEVVPMRQGLSLETRPGLIGPVVPGTARGTLDDGALARAQRGNQ